MKKNFLKIMVVAILLSIVTIGCNKTSVTGVTLDRDNITLSVGITVTLTETIYPDDATNKTVSWTSSNTAVATVENGKITAKGEGAATITVITKDGKYSASCAVTVTPKEEGIVINGIRWAARNVDVPGTFAATPQDPGMLYQWNRKVGWSAANPMVNSAGGTAWEDSGAEGDSWEKANDPCPSGWRVPTNAELQSLIDAGSQWTTDGVIGRIFGSDENTLFLPAAGYRNFDDGALSYVGTYGYYWSSDKAPSGANAACLFFLSDNLYIRAAYRTTGFSVRCVAE